MRLFEFEDLPWFPNVIREGMTDFLRFMITTIDAYEPIIPLIREGLEHTDTQQIVDLCAGAGGGISKVQQNLEKQTGKRIPIILTDKFPNLPAYEYLSKQTGGALGYEPAPVDATNVPARLQGFRTLFSSFHHFAPATAKAILQDAADKRVPIGIFEGAGKGVLEVMAVFFLFPVLFLVCTPFMKPFKFSRLVFTYLVPLIPLCTMWDGLVSIIRLYTPGQLLQLSREIQTENYVWKAGEVKHKIGTKVSYLVGYPVEKGNEMEKRH